MINMKTLTKSRFINALRLALMAILAAAAGFVNGFLGTGGGIVLMAALCLVPKKSPLTAKDKFATVIAVILPLSLLSAILYGESAPLTNAVPYILPGILGGVCGALLLDRLRVGFVKKLFAVMVIWAGVNFIR